MFNDTRTWFSILRVITNRLIDELRKIGHLLEFQSEGWRNIRSIFSII